MIELPDTVNAIIVRTCRLKQSFYFILDLRGSNGEDKITKSEEH